MSELWLKAEAGPEPADLAERVAWWEARERSFRAHAPQGLRGDPRERPPAAHAESERYLPLASIRGDVHYLLQAWFGDALSALEVDLETSALGRARSWLDVPYALPTQLLARLGDAHDAHALLMELYCAPRLGSSFERYPERRAALRGWVPGRAEITLWDAGCATGEGTWALAQALECAGARVEALGTTPWPLERLIAERGAFPHDPARTAAFRAARAKIKALVRFATHDLTTDPAPGEFDVVACHGVLGGCVEPLPPTLEALAAGVRPGGLLSITSDFRADLHAKGLAAAASLGWPAIVPGLLQRPA